MSTVNISAFMDDITQVMDTGQATAILPPCGERHGSFIFAAVSPQKNG